MHLVFPKKRLFSKSIELILASHATSHGCLVTLCSPQHRLQTGSVSCGPSLRGRSMLQKLSYLRAFTQVWVIPPSLPGIDVTALSLSPTTAPKLLSTATETPPDVCFWSSMPCSFVCDSRRISGESPSFLCLLVELLFHFLLLQSVPDPKEDIASSSVSSHVLPLGTPH